MVDPGLLRLLGPLLAFAALDCVAAFHRRFRKVKLQKGTKRRVEALRIGKLELDDHLIGETTYRAFVTYQAGLHRCLVVAIQVRDDAVASETRGVDLSVDVVLDVEEVVIEGRRDFVVQSTDVKIRQGV